MAFLLFCALLAASGSICTSQSIDFSLPVTAAEYQGFLGPGMNANYFSHKSGSLKYDPQNIQILKGLGFQHIRLRCRASLYDSFYSELFFDRFLANLVKVVDDCIDNGIAPIVTFRHLELETRANEQDLQNYLEWWSLVAENLKFKNYLLSFNLFTELGTELCEQRYPGCGVQFCCRQALSQNTEKYHRWTREVISIIRGTGGNNAQRILILASPKVSELGLWSYDYRRPREPRWIDLSYMDSYMIVDWHRWAAGPSADPNHPIKPWSGNGTDQQKEKLNSTLQIANDFTTFYGIPTYQGEWMPRDKRGLLNQMEVMSFAKFFIEACKKARIPWTLNQFDEFYDTQTSTRKTNIQTVFYTWKGEYRISPGLNMSLVLDTIVDAM